MDQSGDILYCFKAKFLQTIKIKIIRARKSKSTNEK